MTPLERALALAHGVRPLMLALLDGPTEGGWGTTEQRAAIEAFAAEAQALSEEDVGAAVLDGLESIMLGLGRLGQLLGNVGVAPGGQVPEAVPVNTAAPTSTGILTVGQVQTMVDGDWSNPPITGRARKWQSANDPAGAGAADIAGETAQTLNPGAGLAGKYFRPGELASNAVGPAAAYASGAWRGPLAAALAITGAVAGAGTTGAAYDSGALEITGGHAPYTISLLSGSLPAGATFASVDADTFKITAASLGAAGTYAGVIQVADADGLTTTKAYSITVSAAASTLTVPTGPAAIYSTKKVTGWSGSCIRVRRTSDNTETDIGFGSDGFVDAAAAFAWAGANTVYVTKWYDQSGNARDATQTTASLQPMLDSTNTRQIIFNGQRSGTSDGGVKNKVLNLPAGLSVPRATLSAFAVVTPAVSYNNNMLFELGGATNQLIMFTAGSAGAFGLRCAAGTLTAMTTAPRASKLNVIGTVTDAAKQVVHCNNTTTTGSAPTAATLTGGNIGSFVTTAGAVDPLYNGTYDYSAFVVYASTLSAGDITSLKTALQDGFTTEPSMPYRVVFDGDSITEHYYATKNRNITKLVGELLPSIEPFNMGISGRTLAQCNTGLAANVQPLYSAGKTKNIVVIAAGINDTGATSSSTGRGLTIRNYCATVRSYGYKVIVCTLAGATSAWASIFADDANRQAYNADLVANWASFADGLIDFAALPEMSNPANTTYFLDGLHPTDAGHAARAAAAKAAIDTLLAA